MSVARCLEEAVKERMRKSEKPGMDSGVLIKSQKKRDKP